MRRNGAYYYAIFRGVETFIAFLEAKIQVANISIHMRSYFISQTIKIWNLFLTSIKLSNVSLLNVEPNKIRNEQIERHTKHGNQYSF